MFDHDAKKKAEDAILGAERRGFRLAVWGRGIALAVFAAFYLVIYPFPNNILVCLAVVAFALAGLVPLLAEGTRREAGSRLCLFAIDATVASSIIAFAPLSSGGDVPQNLVFLSSRTEFYYVILATAILTLSPSLVAWTGTFVVLGLLGTSLWIAGNMDDVVGLGSLPRAPSREEVLSVLLDPNFFAIPMRISEGIVLALLTGVAAFSAHRARTLVRTNAMNEASRSHVQQLFGRYVPTQIIENLVENGSLEPQSRMATVLFADIAGFSRLSERLPPAEIISILNQFFEAATKCVDLHDGVVVNYVGDAIIAAFNTPLDNDRHAGSAIDAARALLELVSRERFGGEAIALRIGVASGTVSAGTVGGAMRQIYTVYGDTVNQAQRLEELNKQTGTACLISRTTIKRAKRDPSAFNFVGSFQLRGHEKTTDVFAMV